MSFKKLIPYLKEQLSQFKFEAPTDFQKLVLSKIKGGANITAIAPENSGKTTALIISVIQKLNAEAFEDVPRALIFVKDKQAVFDLQEEFNKWLKDSDLRIAIAFEEGNINDQKDNIYIGSDIVIGTPKRLNKIYFQNGLNLANLQLFVVNDAEFLAGTSFHTEIHRISESLNKCQYIVFANQSNNNVQKISQLLMEDSEIITVS